MAGEIVHASANGYAACGAEQRPVDAENGFLGDVVSGMNPPTCPKCRKLKGRTECPTPKLPSRSRRSKPAPT